MTEFKEGMVDHRDIILKLPDRIFYSLVAARLNVPLDKSTMREYDIEDENREYWTVEYLRENLFRQLASVTEIIENKNRRITIHKYFTQARRIWKWIPIARPSPEFVVNISDLSPRIVSELYSLDKSDYNYVITRAVDEIFEYIDPQTYRRGLLKNLKVRLDR